MEQDDEDPPPFWLRQLDQHQHQHRHQRRVSSMFLNTGVLVIVLMVTAVIFLAIVIPSVVSLSRQLFNPSLVKRSWSSLNVLLVIFAIVCGFLSRKDDDNTPVNSPTKKDEYPEKMQYSNNFGDFESVLRLRRNSSSYPDLRQESNWPISDNKWRFNDDTHVDNHQFPRFDRQVSYNNQVEGTKDIQVAYESRTTPSSQPPSTLYLWPSPPPPSPPRRGHSSITSKKKTIQTFETIGHGRYKWKNSGVRQPKPKKVAPPSPPPPPPPTPPPSSRQRSRPVVMDNYTENKDFFTSFYYQSKKGKHKRRSYENLENLVEPLKATSSIHRSKSTPEFPPPLQPPPSSPHSVFNNLFSKKSKPQKKVKPTKVNPPTPKKPLNHILSFTTDDKSGVGDESPMRPIPPPPPPPPFKMKPLRFVKQGDYVKIESNNNNKSSITTIPCHNYSTSEEDESSKKSVSLFSPSPDVNIKAEDFIAKFRAKLNLEKSNSINLRQGIVPSRLRT